MATAESKRFEGTRVVVTTEKSFDQVVARLVSLVGQGSIEQFTELARAAESREAFEHAVRQFVGASDFMRFAEFNHGAWLRLFGIHRRMVRWIFGNPLIAFTMIRHDIAAGLFAPVEMLITERDDGSGAELIYVLPSSLMVIEDNPPLLAAAKALDQKMAALIECATA